MKHRAATQPPSVSDRVKEGIAKGKDNDSPRLLDGWIASLPKRRTALAEVCCEHDHSTDDHSDEVASDNADETVAGNTTND